MIRIRKDVEGWTDYLLWLRNIARSAPADFSYVEVGAWKGQSILAMADCLEQYGKSGTLIAVSFADHRTETGELEIEINLGKTNLPTRIESGSPLGVAAQFPNESADVIFMDAAHKYESFMDELVAWWPKVKPGGIFGGHDYNSPQWVDVAPTVNLWAAIQGLRVNFEAPHVWWVQKPGGVPWFRKTLWQLDLKIPVEHGTNPGVCRDPKSGQIVCVFRTTSWGWGLGRLWIGFLNETSMAFDEVPALLRLGPEDLNYEDPRLFVFQNQLWLMATVTDFRTGLTNRLGVAPLVHTPYGWDIARELELFESPVRRRQEKNWVFFDYHGELRSIYGMDPWIVQSHKGSLATIAQTAGIKWDYGHIRGGSQFFHIGDGNRLWAFFHSTTDRRYVAGLVEVDSETMLPVRMTIEPLFQDEDVVNGWTGYPVLWAAGAAVIGDEVLVSYGINDHTCHLRLEKIAELEAALCPV